MGKPNRIAEWRKKMKMTQDALAARVGISTGYLSRLEGGGRNVSLKYIAAISQALGVPVKELVANQSATVPVVGYVSAGALTVYYDVDPVELDKVPAPDGSTDKTVAVVVRGDCLGNFFDNWLAFYDEVSSDVGPDLLGQLCVVRTSDGKTYIKKITAGGLPKTYTLISQFEPPLYDEEIEFAAKIKTMTPR